MAVDLHTHSTASDGTDTPTAVIEAAAAAGLGAVALTDHDTLLGQVEAEEAARRTAIELISGVELSLEAGALVPGSMHMVVLFLADAPGPLQDRLTGLGVGRHIRNQAILERLAVLGIDISAEEMAAEAGTGSAGRPHIAAVMVRHGHVPDIEAAFDRYLAAGRPAYVDRPRLGPEEAIGLARRSGGVPVLAHPQTLDLDDRRLRSVLSTLKQAGLVGVETDHAGLEPERRRRFRRLVDRAGLLPSGGSDYHGAYKPGLEVGTGAGDLEVPDSYLADLRAARP